MRLRKLETSGLEVSAVGLGCMGLNVVDPAIDLKASKLLVQGARGTGQEQYT